MNLFRGSGTGHDPEIVPFICQFEKRLANFLMESGSFSFHPVRTIANPLQPDLTGQVNNNSQVRPGPLERSFCQPQNQVRADLSRDRTPGEKLTS